MKVKIFGRMELSYGILLNLVNAFFPILIIPLVTRSISLNEYGEYISSILITNLMISILVYGMQGFYIRESTNNKEPQAISSIFCFNLIMAVLATFIHLVILIFLGKVTDFNYLISLLATFSFCFFSEWYFFARNKISVLLVRTIVVRTITLIFIATGSLLNMGVEYFITTMVLSFCLYNILGFIFFFHENDLKLNFSEIPEYFKKIKYFLLNSSLGSIYQYYDQFLVGVLLGRSDLALYNIYKQVVIGISSFSVIVCKSIMGKTCQQTQSDGFYSYIKSIFKIYLLSVAIIAVLSLLSINMVVGILANHNIPTVNKMSIISAGIVFVLSIAVFVDSQLSIPLKIEYITTISNSIVACVIIVLVYSLTNKFGYQGALFSLLIGEFAGLVCMVILNVRQWRRGKQYVNK